MAAGNGPTLPKFPRSIIHPLGPLFRFLPLSLRRHLMYWNVYRKWGNFREPMLASEKMQWRIINDRRPVISWTADKLAQKEYIRSLVASGAIDVRIPETLWAGTDAQDLLQLIERYPSGWVFKPNHSSSRYRIYEQGLNGVSTSELRELVRKWSARDEEELVYGNWAYGLARHLLVAEERIGSATTPPVDLKIYCYGGKAHVIFNTYGLHTTQWRAAYYTPALERVTSGFFSEIPLSEATEFDALPIALRARVIPVAEAISAPFDSMRVDLYIADGAIWFGELTTYSASGLIKVNAEVDRDRGILWQLPDLSAPDPREAEWRSLLEPEVRGALQKGARLTNE
jgi:hypothetical protein